MPTRNATAEWKGTLKEGKGTMKLGSGAFEGQYNFSTRFEEGKGTNPEELIAAAHAGCFSMALSNILGQANLKPEYIRTKADVVIEKVNDKPTITKINLECEGKVPGADAKTFEAKANDAKTGCIVSRLLSAAQINLTTKFVS
ncbi:MAG: OsmC family protein [Planctomycetes bacterium]|nr:OsmC family protein [Planctomycetota bacterium]